MNLTAWRRLIKSRLPLALGRTTSGATNDSEQTQHFSDVEPDCETRLGGSLALMDGDHSETIDYPPPCFRSGLAKARRAPLDLQKIH
jgi:hypothetical protein